MCDQCVTKCDQLTLFMKFLKHLLLFINFLYVLLQIMIIIPTFKPIFVTSRRTSSHMKLFHVRRVYTLLYVVYPYLIPISIITQPIEYTIIRVEGFHTFTISFYTITIIKLHLYFLARICYYIFSNSRRYIMNDLTVEEMRSLLSPNLPPADNLRRLEEIDALTGLLSAKDLERLQDLRQKYIAENPLRPDYDKLSKYQKFLSYGEDIYLYILAKYNSRTRASRVASLFVGCNISPNEIDSWCNMDEELSARHKAAVEEFRDRLREEIFRRAVEGEDKEVYDKEGNHIATVKQKNDKLLEKILSANCEEYKDKTPTGILSAGNIVFNVMNFSTEVEEIMEAEVVDKNGGGNSI